MYELKYRILLLVILYCLNVYYIVLLHLIIYNYFNETDLVDFSTYLKCPSPNLMNTFAEMRKSFVLKVTKTRYCDSIT